MSIKFGCIQGRLSKVPNDKYLQYFPKNWENEISLLKKVNFTDIYKYLLKLINMKEIITLSQNKPGSIKSIISLNEIIRKKIYQIIK